MKNILVLVNLHFQMKTLINSFNFDLLKLDIKLDNIKLTHAFDLRCDISNNKVTFYVDSQKLNDWDGVGFELCRVFGVSNTNGVSLGRLLS